MGTLILQDGTVLQGKSFGASGSTIGEIIFNTSTVGYQEILSDKSYLKQIVVLTYPEIGNYGINDYDFEGENGCASGLIVKNYCKDESHYRSKEPLSDYLIKKNIIALSDIDTKSLMQRLKQIGTTNAFISSSNMTSDAIYEKVKELQHYTIEEDIVSKATCSSRYVLNPKGEINLAFIDLGTKKSLPSELAKRNCKVTIYPAQVDANEILENNFDAVFLSGGPGNPMDCTFQINQIKQLMNKIPIFGVSLGCELIAIASGAKTYKLKNGHHSNSIPVINLENNKVIMTSQNHGYGVDIKEIKKFMRPTYINVSDDSLEGFEISSLGMYAVQFNPEGHSGSLDALCVLDEWTNIMKRNLNKINEVENER